MLADPLTGLMILAILVGDCFVWRDMARELDAGEYGRLQALAAQSCKGASELAARIAQGPVHSRELMGLELHLRDLAKTQAQTASAGAPGGRCVG